MDETNKWVLAEAIHSMYQAPLYHLILEGLLIIWILRLIFFKSYKIYEKISLSEEERQNLIAEWCPDPLVPLPSSQSQSSKSHHYRSVTGRPGKTLVVNGYHCLNFASMNFLGLAENSRIEETASKCVKKYGVGSCGPRAFYGTVDVHVDLERALAKFMKAEKAIIYSYGFATVASAIPAYSKRGDIIFADEAVSFAIQKGIQASRSGVVYFKHNDLNDLEAKLKLQETLDKKDLKKAAVTRKFIIVEGIYFNSGEICDLPKLIELKYKYKVRLIIEESLSFGVLGDQGRGVTEHFNVPIGKVDLICASLEYALASSGGFCCGRAYVIDHQCLSGQGYVFSASLPPLLAEAAREGLEILTEDDGIFLNLQAKAKLMQSLLERSSLLSVVGFSQSPSFHLRSNCPVQSDFEYLSKVVDQCMKDGVCLTMASRLHSEELIAEWPSSIRVAVCVQVTEEEIRKAADIICKAAEDCYQKEKNCL